LRSDQPRSRPPLFPRGARGAAPPLPPRGALARGALFDRGALARGALARGALDDRGALARGALDRGSLARGADGRSARGAAPSKRGSLRGVARGALRSEVGALLRSARVAETRSLPPRGARIGSASRPRVLGAARSACGRAFQVPLLVFVFPALLPPASRRATVLPPRTRSDEMSSPRG